MYDFFYTLFKTVCQFVLPSHSVKHYIHRVGRTARAGKKGRSVTLVGESERKMLKEVVKLAKGDWLAGM